MAHVFLSYSSHDRDRARSLFDQLQDAGVSLWADFVVRSGNLRSQAADALERAEAVVVLVSSASLNSSEVTREWSSALDRGLPVIPALLPGEEFLHLPPELRDEKAYKLGDNWTSAVKEIAFAINGPNDAGTAPAALASAPLVRREQAAGDPPRSDTTSRFLTLTSLQWTGWAAIAGCVAALVAILALLVEIL